MSLTSTVFETAASTIPPPRQSENTTPPISPINRPDPFPNLINRNLLSLEETQSPPSIKILPQKRVIQTTTNRLTSTQAMKLGHILALCVISGAAGAQFAGQSNGLPSPYQIINYRNVAQGNNSRITEARTDVIKDPRTWQTFYSQMAGDPQPGLSPAPILVDFNRQELIVIHTGRQITNGHSVYVSMIRRDRPSEVNVEVVINQPARNLPVTRMNTSPYVVVAVDRQTVPYAFRSSFSITTTISNGPANGICGCVCGGCCCRTGLNRGPQSQNNNAFGPEILPPLPANRGGGE